MKSELIVIGKTVDKHIIACIEDYNKRISHYMSFGITTIPNIKDTKNMSEDVQKEKEGEMILKMIQSSDHVVLLDEHGAEFRSIEYANWLKQKQNTARRLIFIIGGPYCFSPDVY